MPVAAALAAVTRYRGDWPTQRFLLFYMAPLFAFGAVWARATLSTMDDVDPRVVLVDGLAFVAGAIRAGGGWGILPYSGHMLFLTFVALTTDDRRFRWTAVALLAITSWFKLMLWHDWRSWSLGVVLGAAFVVARRIVLHRPSLMRPPLLIAVLCVVGAPLTAQAPGKTVCPPKGVTAHGCVLRLARRAGTFQVPPLASIGLLGKNPDGKEIILEDSTVVNVWVTESPATGGMASGGSGIDSLTHSGTVVSRHAPRWRRSRSARLALVHGTTSVAQASRSIRSAPSTCSCRPPRRDLVTRPSAHWPPHGHLPNRHTRDRRHAG